MNQEQGANRSLKVAAIALDIQLGDVEANLNSAARLVASLENDTDVAVLPELFTTGFIQDAGILHQIAREYGARTLCAVKEWSRKTQVAISGSYLEQKDDAIYNRGFFVTPDGSVTLYDKRHLFCLSPESRMFTRGEALPPTVNYKGWNIAMIICYDLRFPVWCRNNGLRYDMLLVPANWPQARAYAWQHLLIARAIENQAVVVGANRSGEDEFGSYNNLSFIIDPFGRILAPASEPNSLSCGGVDDEDGLNAVIYAEYSLEQINKVRRRLPVSADADAYSLTDIV